jgi:hypothetical protein
MGRWAHFFKYPSRFKMSSEEEGERPKRRCRRVCARVPYVIDGAELVYACDRCVKTCFVEWRCWIWAGFELGLPAEVVKMIGDAIDLQFVKFPLFKNVWKRHIRFLVSEKAQWLTTELCTLFHDVLGHPCICQSNPPLGIGECRGITYEYEHCSPVTVAVCHEKNVLVYGNRYTFVIE